VFVHEKSALSSFRLFSTLLVINDNTTQTEISRAFGVPLVTVKSYCVSDADVHGREKAGCPALESELSILAQKSLVMQSGRNQFLHA
jgi:hypothetical protein